MVPEGQKVWIDGRTDARTPPKLDIPPTLPGGITYTKILALKV